MKMFATSLPAPNSTLRVRGLHAMLIAMLSTPEPASMKTSATPSKMPSVTANWSSAAGSGRAWRARDLVGRQTHDILARARIDVEVQPAEGVVREREFVGASAEQQR